MAPPAGPSGAVEREVKLGVAPGFRLPDLADLAPDLRVGRDVTVELDAVYHDTPDLRLVRRGASLRRRTGEERARWTLKLPVRARPPGSGLLARREIDVVSDSSTVPAELGDLVTALVRRAPLGPVVRLATSRRQRRLFDVAGAEVVEIDEDLVSVIEEGTVAARFAELEVEMIGDDTDRLAALVAALVDAGAGSVDPTPKVARALGPRALVPPELAAVPIDEDANMGAVARHALVEAVALIVDHDPVIRLGDDPEGVHRARVGARRLRAHLRLFREVLDPERSRELVDDLRWLGRELGGVRDHDVLLEWLRRATSQLEPGDRAPADGLVEQLRRERRIRTDELLEVLRGGRYVALLDDLVRFASDPPLQGAAGRAAADVLPGLVRRRFRRLRRAVRALRDRPTDDDLHAIRISAKRVRYAGEVAALVVGRRAERFAARAADVQDLLGEVQDVVVARRWLRRTALAAPPDVAFLAGELSANGARRAADLRKRWPRTWDRLDRPKLTRWMAS